MNFALATLTMKEQKLDAPIGADEDSHMPNIINFSWSHPPKWVMRSHASTLSTIVEGVEDFAEQVHASPPSRTNICHITAI